MDNLSIAGVAGFVTLEQYTSAHFVIYQVLIPIIAIVGIVGNGMSLFILAENKSKYAFATYLKALTVADICVLVVAVVRFAVDMSGYFISKDTFVTIKAYEQFWNRSFVRAFFQQLTACFVTIVSVERCVAVIFPLKVKLFVLDRHPNRVVLMTLVVYIIMAIPTLFFSEVSTVVDPLTNVTTTVVRKSEFGKATLPFFSIFILVVKVLIPLIIVISTTLAIVFKLRLQRDHIDGRRNSASKWCLERDKMTIVLIVIATFFTCNAIAALSITTINVFFQDAIKRQPLLFLLCRECRLVLVFLNSANDFIVYILCSKQFRELFTAKFCSRRIATDNTPSEPTTGQELTCSSGSVASEIFHSGVNLVSFSDVQP